MKKIVKYFNYQVEDNGLVKNNDREYYIIQFTPISILGYKKTNVDKLTNIIKLALNNIAGQIQLICQSKQKANEKESRSFSKLYSEYYESYIRYTDMNKVNVLKENYLIIDAKLNTSEAVNNMIDIFNINGIKCYKLVDNENIRRKLFFSIRMEEYNDILS